ncbi:syntaxin-binding protein 5 isoform X2 [Trichogramma pretiosum]|uniref:syntaxin-binding protein 5 isoform X2 n=1 Tax=Trichogramma pretiosum TaxID=7493 RepID=UPI0006C9A2EA|nr:syntaxin-binding protein 5 isoform X2 [Trichogramma pretiosum]
MKKFTFKGVLDGFRSSVAQQVNRPEQEIVETLRSEHFQVKKTFRHGFPYQPTAMAFDPVQKLLAIGTKSGSLRILGSPGVDVHIKHDGGCAVTQLQFLVNEGALVSSTADDTLHLWNFRQKIPQVVQSLKFQRERITCMHLPLQSKWLYVGTERGNIHVLHIETFVLSGYVINWNKAIEVSRKTHPGAVVHLSDNPLDLSKMLIGYETGQMVLWDLKSKQAEFRWQADEPLRSISWHHEGKQFMCSHTDGSLTTWLVRQAKPINVTHPHAKSTKDGEPEPCKAIQKVEWKLSRSGEAYVIFSGGLAYETTGRTPSITVIQGKTTTVLEMEHNVVDFVTLCDSPWSSDFQDPYAVVVLLQNDLVVIDLLTQGFPCFENPYPMDLHESPVTCCAYFADCPGDLVPAFYSVGSKSQKKTGFSEKEWPLSGGDWKPNSSSYNEIILTGHADGSIKFWDASAGTLQVLYKLKTAKLFEKNRTRSLDNEEDPLAIQLIFLCPESRKLAVVGAGRHVVLFKFKKVESMSEVVTLEVFLVADPNKDTERSPDFDFSNSDDAKANAEKNQPLKVKTGLQKRAAGFQATLVCLTHGPNGELPESITAVSMNSSYGLLAYGNDAGLVVVDIVQKVTLLVMCMSELGGNIDPQRSALRSPKRQEEAASASRRADLDDKARSPSIDQQAVELAATISGESSTVGPAATAPASSGNWKDKLKRQLSKADLKIKSASSSLATTPTASAVSSSTTTQSSQDAQSFSSGHHHQQQQQQQKSSSDNQRTLSPVQSVDVESPLMSGAQDISVTDSSALQVQRSSEVSPRSPMRSANDSLTRASQQQQLQQQSQDQEIARPTNLSLSKTTATVEESSSMKPSMRFKRVVKSLQAKRAEARGGNQKSSTAAADSSAGVTSSSSSSIGATTSSKLGDSVLSERTGSKYAAPDDSGNFLRRFSRIDKIDSSFQRSRSSSMSSLENIATETVSCLTFADSYTKKSDSNALPTLWIGTSSGFVQTIVFNTPASGDRNSQPVIISSCNASSFKLKGCMLTISFLDCNGALIPYSYESWKDENSDAKDRKNQGKLSSTRMSPSINSQGSGTDGYEDRQFVVLTSEKQARVVALPSQNCVYKQQLADSNTVIKAEITSLKDSVCLVCYASNGHICTYSLPSLRPLIDVDLVPVSDLSFQTTKHGIVDPMLSIWGHQLFVNGNTDQIARTLCFSNKGHALYLSSPSEIQKFTVSSEFCSELTEMMGDLFIGQDMPEPPKEGFFKGLFGGGARTVDREELFGEASGKALRTVANRIPGPNAGTDALRERAQTATSEVAMAHQMVVERGDKLSQLEERTGRMMNESENFASSAHSLMLKYKDKKWYQL